MRKRFVPYLAGLLGGAANGFFGAGGGVLLVPLLTRWQKLPARRALATSLAVVLPLSALSMGMTLLRGGLDWGAAWPYLAGGAAGGGAAALWFQKVPTVWLRRAFGVLLLVGGARSLLALGGGENLLAPLPLAWAVALALGVGVVTGFVSGCGVGGGSLLLLYLTGVAGASPYAAGGINLAYFLCCCPVALAGHIRHRLVDWRTVWRCLVTGLPAALLCAWLASMADVGLLRRLFGGGLAAVGVVELLAKPPGEAREA